MITIVDVNEKHVSGFHLAFDSVARERQFLARTEAPALESLLSSVVEGISKSVPCVVAVDNDTVVGWCQILPHTRPTENPCGTLGMGIVASYRKKGIGAELLRQALLRAKSSGLERVELEVFDGNDAAIRLYERAGFHREGKKEAAVKIDGTYLDTILMAMFLKNYVDTMTRS